MQRNTTTLFLECPNAILPIPWDGVESVISNIRADYQSPTKDIAIASWEAFLAGGQELEIIPDPIAPEQPPDWDGLLRELLTGSLNPIFRKITLGAINDPAVLLARQDIYGAISNSAIEDRLSALRAGLDMLEAAMQLDQADRDMWNSAIATLNFPDTVRL